MNTILLNRILNNFNTSSYLQNLEERMSFLQRKRGSDYNYNYNYINNNYQNFDQRNNNFNLSNVDINKLTESFHNNEKFFNLGQELIRPEYINNNNCNINKFQLNINSFNLVNSPQNKENIDENDLNSKTTTNNFNYNLYDNKINDSQDNKIVTKKKDDNINANNNSTDSTKSPIPINNNISSKKCNFFNVTHIKKGNEKPKKRRRKRKTIKQAENNNEIKVLKNNKVVYVNNFLLNSYSTSKNIKKLNTIAFIGRNKRSSRFRGVSKNGNQWQVLMMINKHKTYIGSYASEEFAARIYDVLAIKNRGMKARTNFIYSCKQIKNICEKDIDIKSKNILEIISQLVV